MKAAKPEWKPRRLDELGFLGRGKSRHRPRNEASLYGGPYPFIQTADVMAADPFITSYSQTYSEFGFQQSKMWPPETLCMTIAGANTAKTAILKFEACFPDSMVGFIPDKSKSDIVFVKYSLDLMRDRFLSVSRGATQDNLGLEKILSFPILSPDVDEQRRIGAILSAYDELMQNSQRRIRLLEAMARALYREWFVHFRFPGHEKLPRVASSLGEIPQSWEVRKLADFVTTKYGYTESTNVEPVGPKYLRGMDINKTSFIDWSEVPYCPITPEDHEAYRLRIGDVVVIRMADPGKVGIVEQEVDAVFASYLIRVAPKDNRLCPYFLFYLMESAEYYAFITGASTGTTRKSASAGVIAEYQFVLPPQELVEQFEWRVSEIRSLLTALLKKTVNLRRTRDLLLPRLLSGHLQLSKADETETEIIPLCIEPTAKSAKKTTDEFVEAVLIAQLTRKLASLQFPLGRLRYNKLGYFAHRKAEDDVTEHYLKKAAGPYSPWAKYQGPETIALKNGYVKRVKVGVLEGMAVGESIDKIDRYLSHYPACAAVNWVVTMFRYRRNDDLELLATVDFAAIDLLRGGTAVTLVTIKHIIATNTEWAPKLNRAIFSDENITRALTELRGLFPNTYAP